MNGEGYAFLIGTALGVLLVVAFVGGLMMGVGPVCL
jgi:hypothetical protein